MIVTTLSLLRSSIVNFSVCSPWIENVRAESVVKRIGNNTGTPFKRIEEPRLLKAFKICRVNAHIPTQKELAGPLLNQCYEESSAKVKNVLHHPSQNICIVSDGWVQYQL
jgi:hypothetical protein